MIGRDPHHLPPPPAPGQTELTCEQATWLDGYLSGYDAGQVIAFQVGHITGYDLGHAIGRREGYDVRDDEVTTHFDETNRRLVDRITTDSPRSDDVLAARIDYEAAAARYAADRAERTAA
jgi:hypothetical protein